MKHHCHWGLHSQIKKLRAGKLGLLGGVLIVGHLLFHVAECLILPAIIMAINGDNTAEATSEMIEVEHSSEHWQPQSLTGLDVYLLLK